MGKVRHWQDVMAFFQATNEVIGRVPQSTRAEMDAAIAACKRAFPAWADTSILSRQQVLLRYQQLIKENLVRNLSSFPACLLGYVGHLFKDLLSCPVTLQ